MTDFNKDDYQVWTCKIVIKANRDDMPNGFDLPPRMAAENAIADAGFDVLTNSSGWGGSLDKYDVEALKRGREDIYFAGAMDAPEDNQH